MKKPDTEGALIPRTFLAYMVLEKMEENGAPIDQEFDEEWYLNKYPDIKIAIGRGTIKSALEHYLLNGAREGRVASYKKSLRQIVHLHIAKTAGTAVRTAFQRSGKAVLTVDPSFRYDPEQHGHVALFSGHFGYHVASEVRGDIITILREPVDRFLSYYYHLQNLHDAGIEISERTIPAKKYGIDDFVYLLDNHYLIDDLFNSVVWQVAYGNGYLERMEFRRLRSPTNDELLAIAMENMRSFAIVGFQNDLAPFIEAVDTRFGIKIAPGIENANAKRLAVEDISTKTRSKIYEWLHLDVELFRWAETNFRGRQG